MTAPRRKNYAWMWFFGFIVVASVGVAGFMIWFNSRLQLKPEQLEAAMQRWKEHGPSDYLMTFTKQISRSDQPDTFVVRVRAKKVVEVRMNGKLLRNEETQQPYPAGHDQLQYYSMDRLLRDIERFMELDARAGKKNYTVATFDKDTGALETYTRSDRSAGQHVRETVKIEPLPVE
jgi:hypothetical protein